MSKLFTIIIFFQIFILTFQKCSYRLNYCDECDPETDLCRNCTYATLMIPDENGGCIASKKCTANLNNCTKCDSKNELCSQCEINYFPDKNGACSNTENCYVSKESICLICDENYFLTTNDKKCILYDNCYESLNGECIKCDDSFYFDNTTKLCKNSYYEKYFHNCEFSIDGKKCTQCNDGYFFSENEECVDTKYCKISQNRNAFCEECSDGFYKSVQGFCTSSQNCQYSNRENGNCQGCISGYYLDLSDNKCKSNLENNEFKHCLVGKEKCEECVFPYILSDDFKCTVSQNCSVANNEVCEKCQSGYYLSKLDKKCTSVENCILVNYNGECLECEDNYHFNSNYLDSPFCVPNNDQKKFENCKTSNEEEEFCTSCKKNYYLNLTDRLCYPNTLKNNFYKCIQTDPNNDQNCFSCEDNYYLSSINKKCSQYFGCANYDSENNRCVECLYHYCKNNSDGYCYENFNYLNSDILYRCKQTNDDGTLCRECVDNYKLKDGKCVDTLNCQERNKNNGVCLECTHENEFGENYCYNYFYGCVKTNVKYCSRCNNNDNLTLCTSCIENYRLDENNNCVKCKEGCVTCSNNEDCGYCTEGYFEKKSATYGFSYDAICEKCKEGCKECTNEEDCESCLDGYYIRKGDPDYNNAVCNKCSEGCINCENSFTCLKCDKGYLLALSGIGSYCRKLGGY